MLSKVNNVDLPVLPRALPGDALASVAGFYFGFRTFIMLLAVRILGTEPRTGTALSLTCDFLLLGCVLFCAPGEMRYGLRELLRLPAAPWVAFFLGFSGCSLIWSSTISIATSSVFWCGMVADFAIVYLLVQSRSLVRVTDALMRGYVWGACVLAVIAWLMPAQPDLRLGDDELLGPNQIGYVCGFAFFLAQYLILVRKKKFGGQAFLLAITLLRSLSKTSIVAFIAGGGYLLFKHKAISRRNKIYAALAATVAVGALWGLLTTYFQNYASNASQSTTLTGRIGMWAYFLAEALRQPWIGHGFDSVWNVVPPFGPDQFEAAHAHNEILQQFYAYGVVGIGLFLAIYGNIYRHFRRLARSSLRTFMFAFLLFVLVRGFADTERFDLSLPMWAILMFSLLIEQERAARYADEARSWNQSHSAESAPGLSL